MADKLVTKSMESKQNEITIAFKQMEQDHISVKFHCNEFLNEMLRK
jgi:predicted metalloenzyme YecM